MLKGYRKSFIYSIPTPFLCVEVKNLVPHVGLGKVVCGQLSVMVQVQLTLTS